MVATNSVPSSSTFSFKAPFPVAASPSASATALKQRRVSLASPSSPRVVQPWSFRDEMGLDSQSSDAASSSLATGKGRSASEKKGKMRKVDPSNAPDVPEKKPRKKWTQEETDMLVNGCQIHGVGNWKTILQDPNLKFQDRTAVDLKDRFRTYFPDAYKKHYPNAKTHLSNKIRSTFPDGTSLFEKTRSKRRRPFTEAEDAALKAGYEKHGTTWATIVKDPIFQEQNRRSTDLRDRFRNAFPHLYQAAGYKPRTTVKKKADGPVRAADDNLSQMSTAGPVRSRRKAQSRTGYLRGGTKSVPQSTACSEDDDSSAGEEEEENSPFKMPATPVFKDNIALPTSPPLKESPPTTDASTPASSGSAGHLVAGDLYMETHDDMDLVTIDTDIPDFLPNDTQSDIEAWSSGINTPTHSSTAAWSIAGASPTSSHLSDFLMSAPANTSNNASNASSPFIHRRNDGLGNNMIGKSAWGQDWFLSNPRLDGGNGGSNSSSSFIDNSFSPASPFSFHPHLNHGVLDRYDLFPPSIPNDISSDAGLGDSHTTFSDDHGPPGVGASAGGTGFKGYHSQIAGDLISGTGSRMQSFSSLPLAVYGSFGSSFTSSGNEILGLGLEGIPEDAGIHPMQLDAHTSSFSAIDELGLTSISLNDNLDSSAQNSQSATNAGTTTDTLDVNYALRSPDPVQSQRINEKNEPECVESSILNDPFNLDDLVDMSNESQHETPPATPIMAQSRPMRRSSQGAILHNFDGHSNHHARSISVPPSEARNPGGGGGGGGIGIGSTPMSVDDVGVGVHIHSPLQHPNSPPEMTLGKGLQSLFGIHSPVASSPSSVNLANRGQRLGRNLEPMTLSNNGSSLLRQSSAMSSPSPHQHQQQGQQSVQPATLFPAQLLLSSSPSPGVTSASNSSHIQNSNHNLPHAQGNEAWRVSGSSSGAQTWMNPNSITSSDFYNNPYLDLHYTYGGAGIGLGNLAAAFNDPSETRQGQEALDLAQSTALASSGLGPSNLGLNLAFGNGNGNGKSHSNPASSSPSGTIRMHHLSAGLTTLNKTAQPPSDTFGSVAAAIAAANAVGRDNNNNNSRDSSNGSGSGGGGVNIGGTGTIRQSHFKSSNSGVGRSMSHHRGQSAVCPQDLELRNDNNKRKRASWDGGLV